MRYWPLSVLKESSLMPAAYAWELTRFYQHLPSRAAFEACLDVARQTPSAETGLLIIESVNAPMRYVYGDYPEFDDWFRLERAGVFQTEDGYLFMTIDALH